MSKTPPSNLLTVEEVQRRLHAYRRSRRDEDAARRLGLKIMTFRLWRIRRGLPAKGPKHIRYARLPPWEVRRRKRALMEEPTVRAASRRLGVYVGHLYQFIYRYKVARPGRPPPKGRPARPPRRPAAADSAPAGCQV